MQPKSLILLALALGCGVIASIGITQVMANRSSGPAAPKVDTQPVFVALKDIPMGTLLDAQMLKLEQWPKDKVPEGALSKLESVEGRRPRTKLFAGEPILDVKLLSKGESAGGAAPMIPVGYRAVPVRVDEVSGGAAMILPGDRVDVLIYVKRGNEITTTVTKTILQDIKVFAVDSTWNLETDETGKAIRAKTISLLLTPEQTERVMMASELGKIRLALRSPEDHDEAELPEGGHRISQLLGESEISDRQRDNTLLRPEDLAAQSAAALAALTGQTPVVDLETRPTHVVRVISGSKVNEVRMAGPADEEVAAAKEQGSASSLFWQILSAPASLDSDPPAETETEQAEEFEGSDDAESEPLLVPAESA